MHLHCRAPDTPDKEAASQRPGPPAREADEPPRQRSGPHAEASQPPIVPGKVSRKPAVVVGGRSLSGQLAEGLLKDYNGPPNLRGDSSNG